MVRHLTKLMLAAALAVVADASLFGQGLASMQLFAPADVSTYGGRSRANEGYFFVFDGIYWNIGEADIVPIGKAGLTREVFYSRSGPEREPPSNSRIQHNTHNTEAVQQQGFELGNRYEFGHVSGHHGWRANYYSLQDNQNVQYNNVDVVIEDAPFGPDGRGLLMGYLAEYGQWSEGASVPDPLLDPIFILRDLPITFDEMFVDGRVETWSTEWMYMYRMHPSHHGGIFELFAGARYLEFDDEFNVFGTGFRFESLSGDPLDPSPNFSWEPRTVLADSIWNTEAENHIIGPQVGARWSKQFLRWMISAEGRFFAGFNFQRIQQTGILGSQLNDPVADNITINTIDSIYWGGVPDVMDPSSINHTITENEWSPAVEFSLQLKYQFTESVTCRVGWTGLWIDGVARSSGMVDYSIEPGRYFGILTDQNRQGVFVNGATIGIEVNR